MASTLWKLCGISVMGTLDIRSVRLWSGSARIDSTATLSTSDQPVSGILPNLLDGDPATGCTWSKTTVGSPGFFLGFSFPTEVELTAVELDLGSDNITDMLVCQLRDGLWSVAYSSWFAEGEPIAIGRPSEYQAVVLADGASTYLPCNESSGDALDIAGGSSGFLVSSNAVRGQQKLTQGGSALVMPASNGASPLIAAKNAQLGNLNDGYTLEFIMRGQFAPGASKAVIFSKEVGGQYWPEYRLDITGTSASLMIRSANDNGSRALDQTVNIALLDNKRHHITFRREGSRYRLGVDCVNIIDATASASAFMNLGVLSICGDYLLPGYSSSPFIGAVSGVALYQKSLTDAQIASHFEAMGPDVVRRVRSVSAGSAVLPGLAPPAGRSMVLVNSPVARDLEFGGVGLLFGTVRDDKSQKLLQRRVRLSRSRDSYLVRETWSAADGSYRFEGISERYEYDIEAWDHEKNFFSVVANNQLPEVDA